MNRSARSHCSHVHCFTTTVVLMNIETPVNGFLLTAGQAAKQVGVSKPTISRAVSEGRLSALRREDGSFGIDPAELMRWKEVYRHRHGIVIQSVTPKEIPETAALQVSVARLEAELNGAKALLDVERSRTAAVEKDRDEWRKHAQMLLIGNAPERPRDDHGWFEKLFGVSKAKHQN